jgi:RNA-directed DNA polymerase
VNISSIKHLAYLLKCKSSKAELIDLASSLCDKSFAYDKDFYREKKEVSELKNGKFKTRLLNPSIGRLKLIQARIKKNILDNIYFPKYIQGGLKGYSNITNASLHLGNKAKFTTDIKGFFPSIKPTQIYEAFCLLGMKADVARMLTILTSYKGKLPQGTPTSAHVANLIFLPVDKQISTFCQSLGITYSRYIDDITLSSKTDFKNEVGTALKYINDAGFKISARKTQYRHVLDITGISTGNNSLKPNQKFYKRLKLEQTDAARSARLKYLERVKSKKKNR